jgi:hypothetical protein
VQLFPDIVQVFSTEVKTKAKPAEGEGEKKKQEVISFLDSGRARNMGIAISKFMKVGFRVTIRAVMAMDDAAVGGVEGIDTLLNNLPEEKEVRSLLCIAVTVRATVGCVSS